MRFPITASRLCSFSVQTANGQVPGPRPPLPSPPRPPRPYTTATATAVASSAPRAPAYHLAWIYTGQRPPRPPLRARRARAGCACGPGTRRRHGAPPPLLPGGLLRHWPPPPLRPGCLQLALGRALVDSLSILGGKRSHYPQGCRLEGEPTSAHQPKGDNRLPHVSARFRDETGGEQLQVHLSHRVLRPFAQQKPARNIFGRADGLRARFLEAVHDFDR